jgi:hypothetical protein
MAARYHAPRSVWRTADSLPGFVPHADHRIALAEAVVEGDILIVPVRHHVLDDLIKHLGPVPDHAELHAVPKRPPGWRSLAENRLDARPTRTGRPLPGPRPGAAAGPEGSRKVKRRRRQQLEHLDEVRFAGSVRPDEDVERPEVERR